MEGLKGIKERVGGLVVVSGRYGILEGVRMVTMGGEVGNIT